VGSGAGRALPCAGELAAAYYRRDEGRGYAFKIGPLTAKIQELYFRVVKAEHPKYQHWCAPVY